MNQRELSKALTAILGRKPRKDRGIPRRPTSRLLRTPSYRRVSLEEVQRYQRLALKGRSVRAIARCCGRSHSTVQRWLGQQLSQDGVMHRVDQPCDGQPAKVGRADKTEQTEA
jgi:Helix-turn-helix domain